MGIQMIVVLDNWRDVEKVPELVKRMARMMVFELVI